MKTVSYRFMDSNRVGMYGVYSCGHKPGGHVCMTIWHGPQEAMSCCYNRTVDWRKEGCNMVRQIKLTQDQVQKFVNVTSKCDFDIDIYYNRYVVDAKSFLGVYGLDFSRALEVSYEGYNQELEELLNDMAVAC